MDEFKIGVVTDGGIIQTVYVDKDINVVRDKIKDFYGGCFDREKDDARIFDADGDEIESLFSEGEEE